MNNHTRRLANLWAHEINITAADREHAFNRNTEAAAELIRNLPSEIVDGLGVRELIDNYETMNAELPTTPSGTARRNINNVLIRDLKALLPTREPITLAGMTPDERYACLFMQADVYGVSGRYAIHYVEPGDGGKVHLVNKYGQTFVAADDDTRARVTPRPDLPPLEWPTDDDGDTIE